MKLILVIALTALHFPSAFATPADAVFTAPEICKSYTDGDLEQALSCVNALNEIEIARIQYGEDRASGILHGAILGATAGGIAGAAVGGSTVSFAGGQSFAKFGQWFTNAGRGGLVGAGIGAAIGGAIALVIYPEATGAGPSPLDFDKVEDFELFLNMSSEEQIAFINDYNPANLINFIFTTAETARDSALEE